MNRTAVVVVGLALMALASSSCAAPAEGMPAVGTTWKFGFRDQQYGGEGSFSIEVTGVHGAKVEERVYVDGGSITQAVVDTSQPRFRARALKGDDVVLDFAPYSTDLAKRAGALPAGYPIGRNPSWKIERPTYTLEQITVPAGTFATVRMQVTGRSAPVSSPGIGTAALPTRFVYTCWHSNEQHRCVKIRHQTWNMVGQPIGDDLVQLVGYEPGQPAPPSEARLPAR